MMATQRSPKPTSAASAKKLAAKPAPVKKAAVKSKPAAKAKPAVARKPAAPPPTKRKTPAAADAQKRVKPKLVRDSFTIPKAEYTVLGALKQRAVQLGQQSKKSELLRAGVKALSAMADAEFL